MNAFQLATEIVANADGRKPDDPKIDIATIEAIIAMVMELINNCPQANDQLAERAVAMSVQDASTIRLGLRNQGFWGRRLWRVSDEIKSCCERHTKEQLADVFDELGGWSFL